MIFKINTDFIKTPQKKKTNALETMLSKFKERERDCRIFHVRKGTSVSAKRPMIREKKRTTIEVQEKTEMPNDDVNIQLNNEIKKMSKTMTQLKNSQNNKDNEIKALTKEKQNLMDKIEKLEKEKNQLATKNESLKN